MFLLCELIGMYRNKKTKEFKERLIKSSIRRKAIFINVPKLSAKSIEL